MRRASNLLLIFTLFLLILSPPPHVSAINNSDGYIIGEYQIPEDFDLTVRDTCSGHDFFFHVAVRDDGWFAVFHRTAVQKMTKNEQLSHVYIDIFDSSGEFQLELSFESSVDLAIELTDETLDMYFYDHMLSYNLTTGEVQGYRIPVNYAKVSGLYSEFIRKEFEVNDWEYKCGRTLIGYTSLKRTNGNTEELLLSLSGNVPGTDFSFAKYLFFAGVEVSIIIIPYLIWKRFRHKSPREKSSK